MNIVFTKHAKDQMKERNISEDEAINAIKYSEKTQKIGDIYYAQKNLSRFMLKVVYTRENYIKVITLYPL